VQQVVVMALKALKLLTMPSSQSCSSVKQHLKKFTAGPESLLVIILELQGVPAPNLKSCAHVISLMLFYVMGWLRLVSSLKL